MNKLDFGIFLVDSYVLLCGIVHHFTLAHISSIGLSSQCLVGKGSKAM